MIQLTSATAFFQIIQAQKFILVPKRTVSPQYSPKKLARQFQTEE